jgi:peptide/nickel transport system ATP-binding protein
MAGAATIGIALALAHDPYFRGKYEPVSALDQSIQPSSEFAEGTAAGQGLAYMFITHDLSVFRHVSTISCDVYGQMVEKSSKGLFVVPCTPIPGIISASCTQPPPERRHILLKGEVTSPVTRSRHAVFLAAAPMRKRDRLRTADTCGVRPDHLTACHFIHEIHGRKRAGWLRSCWR